MTTSDPRPHVRISGLSKVYGSAVAVDNVSIDIRRGEMIVLLGPSGCGKTTMLRLIAGFIDATSGRVLVDDTDLSGLPPFQRDMGMVFQNYALFPHMTVEENVGFGLRMRKIGQPERGVRVSEVLQSVKLQHLAQRFPAELSGGQQQRVALARALAIRPKLLLLDEPLSNLDANLRHSVAREIRQMQIELGLTAIMVTHDQDEAMMMADRLVLLSDGKLQQMGSQEDLYERPASPFVARFIGHSNILSGRLRDRRELVMENGNTVRLSRAYDAADGKATLSIRPERIDLGPPDQTETGLRGKVVLVSYLGPHVEYSINVGGDDLIVAHQSTKGAGTRGFGVGDQVNVRWQPNHELLFHDDVSAMTCISAA